MRLVLLLSLTAAAAAQAANVIFVHPDGSGVAHWQATRFFKVGPDADLHWDRLPHVAVYRGHMRDTLTATSNGGATTHAYGVKVPAAAFGTDGSGRPTAGSGQKASLMHEAMAKGIRTGLVNSGSLIEPGTACFVTSVPKRDGYQEITAQLIESGVDVIMGGGEEWLLPTGTAGRHCTSGKRTDGRDLIAEARKRGYTVVFDRDELTKVPSGTRRLLGVFAAENTFNDMSEEAMAARDLPPYKPGAPTVAEMTAAALRLLEPGPFFLVVEEEGADNFGNYNNARGVLEALSRADDALGEALSSIERHPDTLLITAADSEAGNMDAIGFVPSPAKEAIAANRRDRNGAPYSIDGGKPFLSKPDRHGVQHPFVVNFGTLLDSSGGIVVRAGGKGAEQVNGTFDNTRIYSTMRESLFGKQP